MDSKLQLLSGVPLFARCKGDALAQLGQLAEDVEVPAGQVLTRQGAVGSEFFFLVEGTVRVEQDGTLLRSMQPGDFFGEIALLDGGLRTATATTETPARLLVIGRREFNALLADYPGVRDAVLEAIGERLRKHEPATTAD